jgi:epoxyqueuosine reductase
MSAPVSEALEARAMSAGRRAGLDHVGVCAATPFDETRRVLEERKAQGLSGGMQFTYRNPARSTDPARTLPGATALVVGAVGYAGSPPAAPAGPHGRVARYAAEDHYTRLRDALGAVAEVLRADGHRAVVVADENSMVDRAAAVRAGLGWYGKSANVLLPGQGSWFVLGSVLTDAPLVAFATPLEDGCGSCTRCLDGCPTGAIVAPGVVDARRCLAWHVQMEGELPHEFRVALGDRLYGCDECQEVCPPSRRHEAGVGSVAEAGGDPGSWVDLSWVLRAGDEELLERLGRWYVPRRDPRHLRRNALVALANSVAERSTLSPADPLVEELLAPYLDGEDDLLAGHAAWAALRVGRRDLLTGVRADRPPIRAELDRWPGGAGHREDGAR